MFVSQSALRVKRKRAELQQTLSRASAEHLQKLWEKHVQAVQISLWGHSGESGQAVLLTERSQSKAAPRVPPECPRVPPECPPRVPPE